MSKSTSFVQIYDILERNWKSKPKQRIFKICRTNNSLNPCQCLNIAIISLTAVLSTNFVKCHTVWPTDQQLNRQSVTDPVNKEQNSKAQNLVKIPKCLPKILNVVKTLANMFCINELSLYNLQFDFMDICNLKSWRLNC